MDLQYLRLLKRFAKEGVLHREETKNDLKPLRWLVRRGYVEKVYKGKQVFYQLTKKSLPLLDEVRKGLFHQACLFQKLYPSSQFYHSLLDDLRFFDDTKKEAEHLKFLGDWQLMQPPSNYQLTLSQKRYYERKLGAN